jgi:hypothetical protein
MSGTNSTTQQLAPILAGNSWPSDAPVNFRKVRKADTATRLTPPKIPLGAEPQQLPLRG